MNVFELNFLASPVGGLVGGISASADLGARHIAGSIVGGIAIGFALYLDQVAERYVAALQAQPVAANVRDMLVQLLPTGEAGQETVARRLNRSLSILQRQLQAEGLSYRQVIDQTRHSLARAYLGDKRFSQAEIAYLLGFSDQSSFSRAYRRWTGQSPGRAEQRSGPVEQQDHQPEHEAGGRTADNADEGVEVAHEGLRQFVVVSARTGNLVVELAVVVGRGRDATHRELAQGLAGDFRGVAERGHGGGLFYRLGEIITAL